MLKKLKIQPYIGLFALRYRRAGAWRAWTLARNLSDNGWIERETLEETLRKFGISKYRSSHWINQAIEVGVFEEADYNRLFYKSVSKAADLFGADYIFQPVNLFEPERLFKNGWRSVLWACFVASFDNDFPISRESLRDITGISPSTQINYERSGLVKAVPVWVERDFVPDWFNKKFYVTPQGKTMERLPNYYTEVPGCGIRTTKKGSLKRYRKELKRSLARKGAGKRLEWRTRLYYKSQDGAANAAVRDQGEKFVFDYENETRHIYQAVSPC